MEVSIVHRSVAYQLVLDNKMNSRKGQGLSIGFIIVTIIAVAVLVVVLFAFNKGFRAFSADTLSCGGKGGECQESCDPETQVEFRGTNCDDNEELTHCCKTVG